MNSQNQQGLFTINNLDFYSSEFQDKANKIAIMSSQGKLTY